MSSNGHRNSGRPLIPPGMAFPPPQQSQGIAVAQPINDLQLVMLMASHIMAGRPDATPQTATLQACALFAEGVVMAKEQRTVDTMLAVIRKREGLTDERGDAPSEGDKPSLIVQ